MTGHLIVWLKPLYRRDIKFCVTPGRAGAHGGKRPRWKSSFTPDPTARSPLPERNCPRGGQAAPPMYRRRAAAAGSRSPSGSRRRASGRSAPAATTSPRRLWTCCTRRRRGSRMRRRHAVGSGRIVLLRDPERRHFRARMRSRDHGRKRERRGGRAERVVPIRLAMVTSTSIFRSSPACCSACC